MQEDVVHFIPKTLLHSSVIPPTPPQYAKVFNQKIFKKCSPSLIFHRHPELSTNIFTECLWLSAPPIQCLKLSFIQALTRESLDATNTLSLAIDFRSFSKSKFPIFQDYLGSNFPKFPQFLGSTREQSSMIFPTEPEDCQKICNKHYLQLRTHIPVSLIE